MAQAHAPLNDALHTRLAGIGTHIQRRIRFSPRIGRAFDGPPRVTAALASGIRRGRQRSIAMAQGTVDFFNHTGGYGFISTDDSDDDVFFHMEDVGGPDLEEGTDIEFDIEQAPKGPRATNVVRQ